MKEQYIELHISETCIEDNILKTNLITNTNDKYHINVFNVIYNEITNSLKKGLQKTVICFHLFKF